jgi:hypothetical protein
MEMAEMAEMAEVEQMAEMAEVAESAARFGSDPEWTASKRAASWTAERSCALRPSPTQTAQA